MVIGLVVIACIMAQQALIVEQQHEQQMQRLR